ncbi:hypothetical protein OK016_05315 [Vibrio chagasii]|nr:hypothetical protein [Vibrio chagasii]
MLKWVQERVTAETCSIVLTTVRSSDGDSAARGVAKGSSVTPVTYDKLVFNVTVRALDFESNCFDRVIATHIAEYCLPGLLAD